MILGRSMILASQESLTVATTYPTHRLHLGDWSNEVTFTIDVQSVNGGTDAPAKIVASMSGVMPHTTGNQYLNERVFGLDAVQKVNLTAEAEDWPNPICIGTSTYPVTVQRTYIGFGKDLRLTLTPTLSGAVTGWTVSIVAHAKG